MCEGTLLPHSGQFLKIGACQRQWVHDFCPLRSRTGATGVGVTGTMGTTDANAFDPLGKVRELMDRYPNPPAFGKAILYADAVVGWSWIYFKDYDFELNPLEFSKRILPMLDGEVSAAGLG